MSKPVFFFSRFLVKSFVLSITFALLTACLSNSSAPVVEKSRANIKRPAAHVVIPGDTLFSIAWRYGLKYEMLAEHNGIRAPYVIRPSQVIRLDVTQPKAKPENHSSPRIGVYHPAPTSKNSKTIKPARQNSQIKQTVPAAPGKQDNQFFAVPQWRWPTNGPVLSSFQSNSGLNKGIDIGGKLGEPVLAAASGKVVYSGSGLRGYGKLLIVKNNETFLSAYAHNNVLRVKEGDIVKAGQVIAEMGSTGTDRVKLHFEIRRDGTPVDPMRFLPKR